MSLINDMLKDLETRGGGPAGGGAIRPVAHRADNASGPSRLVILLSSVVVLLLAALAYVSWNSQQALQLETRLAETATATPARMDVAEHAVDDALAVSGIDETADDAPLPREVAEPVSDGLIATMEDTRETIDEVEETVTLSEVTAESMTTNAPSVVTRVTARQDEAAPFADNSGEGTVVVRRHEPTPEQRAQRAGRDGLAALRRGDWASAARLLQELIQLEPANDDGREGLAVALQRQGRLAEADGVLLDGIAVAAEPARFAKLRARTQVARGELNDALNSLSIAMPAIEDDPEYHALRGAIAQQAGKTAIALDTYSRLTRFEPANGTWQAGLAMALDRADELEEARATYQRALDAGGLEPALLAHVQRRLAALTQHQAD